jgi:hypothetical protein
MEWGRRRALSTASTAVTSGSPTPEPQALAKDAGSPIKRRWRHDDQCDCILRHQGKLCGSVVLDTTVWRALEQITPGWLGTIAAARARVRRPVQTLENPGNLALGRMMTSMNRQGWGRRAARRSLLLCCEFWRGARAVRARFPW